MKNAAVFQASLVLCALNASAQSIPPPQLVSQQGRIGVVVSPSVVTVQPNEIYYLPNDEAKLGFDLGGQYERYFGAARRKGVRVNFLGAIRNGRYVFNNEAVRRQEIFLKLPIEFVVRRPLEASNTWWSTAGVGVYFAELAQRSTFRLDPLSSQTTRQEERWLYGVGGFLASLGLSHQGAREYSEVGLRVGADVGDYTQPRKSGALPNLRCATFGLYYSFTSLGYRRAGP